VVHIWQPGIGVLVLVGMQSRTCGPHLAARHRSSCPSDGPHTTPIPRLGGHLGGEQGGEEEREAAKLALLAVLESVRVVAVLLAPVTPQLSQRIYEQLGLGEHFEGLEWERDATWGKLKAGHVTPRPVPVFVRLDGDYVLAGGGAPSLGAALT
jgi:hypothetical protein